MNLKEVEQVIKLVDSSNLAEFELEMENVKISMKKNTAQKFIEIQETPRENIALNNKTIQVNEEIKEDKNVQENMHNIKSPIVGVFYDAKSPTSEPYVKKGDRVKKGDVLCIVEAMKLMNEITSDVDGVIEEILIQNQGVVEYGQPLFKIRKV